MKEKFHSFLVDDESGAVTVDWVMLSAAAVALSLAATDVVREGLSNLTSDIEAQLRSQQISDAFVNFTSSHFDPLYDTGAATENQAETAFDLANEMTNAEILTALETGIPEMEAGTLSDTELTELYAAASVAHQRNIVDDAVIETYFNGDTGNGGFS